MKEPKVVVEDPLVSKFLMDNILILTIYDR